MWCCKSTSAIELGPKHVVADDKTIESAKDSSSKAGSFQVDEANSFRAFFVQKPPSAEAKENNTFVPHVSYGDNTDDDITTCFSERTRPDPMDPPSITLPERALHQSASETSTTTGVHVHVPVGVTYEYEDEDDDDITTCFSEQTRPIVFPPITLPENAHVKVPDVPQRGYEPRSGYYQDEKMIREKPYEVGSLVWYRSQNPMVVKFNWYIPGIIKNYVMDTNQVTGYVIHVDLEDSILEQYEEGISAILKNAPPEHTMLRWDETTPPCPVAGIDNSDNVDMEKSSETRIKKAKEKYGDDLGFVGAKQNGFG